MSKLRNTAAALLAMPVVMLSGATAFAATSGQIEGGDIYRVRNVTTNGSFSDTVNADKCQVVQFKVRIHNPGPDALTGVKVAATLDSAAVDSQSSKVTVSADNANPVSTSDTAGVKLPASYTIAYEAGSTQLLDPSNNVLQNLPDGVVSGGVTIPNGVGVSLGQIRFVQFKADINCPVTPPVVTPPTPTPTPTPTSAPKAPAAKPAALPNTGAGDVVGLFAGASAVGTAAHAVVSRRNRR